MTNWNSGTVCVDKGTVIGTIEEVSQVGQDDHVWEEAPVPDAVVRMCVSQNSEVEHRQTELCSQISVGDVCTTEEKTRLFQLLMARHQVFALSDSELGETDLVQHKIETNETAPFRSSPRRLPYTLRAELETELTRLEATGFNKPICFRASIDQKERWWSPCLH